MAIIPQNVYYGIKTKYLNKFKIDYQGTVATVSDLPEGDIPKGTVYNVEANGSNYLWNGEEWDELGSDDSNLVHKTLDETISGTKTFSKNIVYGSTVAFCRNVGNSNIQFSGGSTYTKGGRISLCGENDGERAGLVQIRASDSSNTKKFEFRPDGRLMIEDIDISGKNSNYCSDCNTALIPGRYYVDTNTVNSPSGKSGILFVSSKGDTNDSVYQCVISDLPNEINDNLDIIYCRRIVLSSGAYSSASPWGIQNYFSTSNSSRTSLFKESINSAICMSPPSGMQLTGQTSSYYEVLRFYQGRDASRDPSLKSYGGIARFADTTNPTSGNAANTQIALFFCEGGICSDKFIFGAKLKNASVVTYTDETTDTFYGKLYVTGDVIGDKTVESVNYSKEYSSVQFSFTADNVAALGSATSRFAELFAGSGSINTSDERLKESVETIPDEVLDAWGEVGWVQYQFKDAVEKKGEDARLHTGAVAQRIDAVFTAHSLDASRYGLFCHDVWEDEFDEDEDGNRIQTKSAGDRYSLRYEEALCMEAAYQRRRADRAEARIKALEDRLEVLEARLG